MSEEPLTSVWVAPCGYRCLLTVRSTVVIGVIELPDEHFASRLFPPEIAEMYRLDRLPEMTGRLGMFGAPKRFGLVFTIEKGDHRPRDRCELWAHRLSRTLTQAELYAVLSARKILAGEEYTGDSGRKRRAS